MYVLKFNSPCPDHMLENFYDEVVPVRNGIAICVREHVRNALMGMNYSYIGQIEDENGLQELFAHKEQSDLRLDLESKVVDLDELRDITAAKEAKLAAREERKPLINNLV